MSDFKPIQLNLKSGIAISVLVLLTTVFGFLDKWKSFYQFVTPKGTLLSWNFLITMVIIAMIIVWFVMNLLWRKEYVNHQETRFEKENYKAQLKLSENQRLTDVITGVPNSSSLKMDLDRFLKSQTEGKIQFILIDLKNFREANKRFGFLKTNEVLRTVAQSIYTRMRRNEDMYKYPTDKEITEHPTEGFYRIHSGGDEFAFIIKGDQADALGFCNNLVTRFQALSDKTKDILGEKFPLSFHCAIVEVHSNDTMDDIIENIGKCYRISVEGKAPFTICWDPIHLEAELSQDARKKLDYKIARERFEVLTFDNKRYVV